MERAGIPREQGGMKQIAAKYRREDGGLDLCAASCIELDDCVLQEGVPEEGTTSRHAAVRRGRT